MIHDGSSLGFLQMENCARSGDREESDHPTMLLLQVAQPSSTSFMSTEGAC